MKQVTARKRYIITILLLASTTFSLMWMVLSLPFLSKVTKHVINRIIYTVGIAFVILISDRRPWQWGRTSLIIAFSAFVGFIIGYFEEG